MRDMASIIMIVRLVAEGVGVADEIAKLAKRVKNGGKITKEEIEQARKEVSDAVNEFDEAADLVDDNAVDEEI